MRMLAALSALGIVAATVLTGTAQEKGPMQCEVLTEDRGDTINFVGRVRANAKLNGSYELVVQKKGSSGTSDVVQSGAFQTMPEKVIETSWAAVGKDTKAQYTVRLLIKWPGGQQECHWDGTAAEIQKQGPKVTAAGKGNMAVTVQKGSSNQATTIQQGTGNRSTIIQSN